MDPGFRVFSYPSSDVPDSLSMETLSRRPDYTRSSKLTPLSSHRTVMLSAAKHLCPSSQTLRCAQGDKQPKRSLPMVLTGRSSQTLSAAKGDKQGTQYASTEAAPEPGLARARQEGQPCHAE